MPQGGRQEQCVHNFRTVFSMNRRWYVRCALCPYCHSIVCLDLDIFELLAILYVGIRRKKCLFSVPYVGDSTLLTIEIKILCISQRDLSMEI